MTTVTIRTKAGLKQVPVEKIQSRFDAGKLPVSGKIVSLDDGDTWMTVPDLLERMEQQRQPSPVIDDPPVRDSFSARDDDEAPSRSRPRSERRGSRRRRDDRDNNPYRDRYDGRYDDDDDGRPDRSRMATSALVWGILSIPLFPLMLLGLAAIILGALSLNTRTGKGRAIAGLVLGICSFILAPFLAIVAAIAIPNLLESRTMANEAAASASLKSGVFPAQVVFSGSTYQDADNNGVGEFGTIGALCGDIGASYADPGQLTLVTGPLAAGGPGDRLRRTAGYHFMMVLPREDQERGVVREGDPLPQQANGDSLRYRHATMLFMCVAVPEQYAVTGRRIFMLDQTGEVYTSINDDLTMAFFEDDGSSTAASIERGLSRLWGINRLDEMHWDLSRSSVGSHPDLVVLSR